MNRNTNAHFSEIPRVGIQRSILDRSHSVKTSGFVGDVIPIWWDEILPGDTVSMDTSKVIRFQTMLSPVMDNIYADFYTFFCADYQLWDHFVNLMGENTDSAWIPEVQYSVPQIKVPPKGEGSNNKRFTILDYLGYPVEMDQVDDVEVSALPVRAYSAIVDYWFRDENLSDPINIYTGDSTVTATAEASYVDDVPHGGLPFKAAKFKDFWTSMLPSPQKGQAVTFPLISGGMAPVGTTSDLVVNSNLNQVPLQFSPSTHLPTGNHLLVDVVGADATKPGSLEAIAGGYTGTPYNVDPVNLWADLSDSVGAVTVNDLRMAFQLQKLLERDARGGTRYKEVVASHFNTTIDDGRLWHPEYLGGNRVPINVNQVSNTAQSESDFLGDLGANSLTVDVHGDFTKSFQSHGIIMTVMVIRAEHSYCQGIQPKWLRKGRFDFFWPVLANIGEQPYKKESLYLGAEGTFGYQEAWAEYRYAPNELTGTMRPYLSGSLGSWNLGDDYSSAPSLSDDWIREPRENVDRALAVTSETAEQFWCDIYFKIKHTRPMPVYSIPGLIDHH